MVVSSLVLASLQAGAFVRDLRPGVERRYRVELSGGDAAYRYRMRTKIAPKKPDDKDEGPKMDLALTDYRAEVEGHAVTAAKAGGGLLPLAATGLPKGFGLTGARGTLWLPLVAFYLPDTEKEGDFPIAEAVLSDGTTFGGKGVYRKEKARRVVLDATLSRDGKPFATLNLDTTFDDDGWPRKSEGTLVDASGTTSFSLARA